MDKAELKSLLKNEIAPLLIGIRNEITESLKQVIVEAGAREVVLIGKQGPQGEPGVTPVADKDYMGIESIKAFIKDIMPKKGIDFMTEDEISDMCVSVSKLIPKPENGKDGVVNYSIVKELATPLINNKIEELQKTFSGIVTSIYEAIEKVAGKVVKPMSEVQMIALIRRIVADEVKKNPSVFVVGGGGASGGGSGSSSGGGGYSIETPTGTVDGSNASFTVANEPVYVVADGITYFDGAGYTYGGGSITMVSPPVSYIRSFYL